ncbi:MAG: hypothetical protein IKT23_05555, partial [Clostridia bacterium]|nr:hypothetical protein [Clostridia bacterium]
MRRDKLPIRGSGCEARLEALKPMTRGTDATAGLRALRRDALEKALGRRLCRKKHLFTLLIHRLMEIKVTFRFDASESLLAACDNFRKAMEAMSALGGLSSLPVSKEAGIVKAVATEDGVTMNKKEQIWPPKSGGAVPSEVSASPATPT